MKATEDFCPDEMLNLSTGPFTVYSKLGWGQGKWFVIRKSDRKIMTSNANPKACLHWIRDWGVDFL